MKISTLIIVIIFIATTLVVGLSIFNAINYYKIFDTEEPSPTISSSAAKIYFGLNIAVGVINFGIWLWCIYKFLPKERITPVF